MCCRKNKFAWVITGLVLVGNVGAQEPPTPQPGASVPTLPAAEPAAPMSPIAAEIKRINEQISLLNAQLNELDVRAKLAAKQADIDKSKSAGVVKEAPSVMASDALPFVRAIDGFDGKLRATLAMRDGSQQSVAVGDSIAGWYVREISVNAVSLSRSKNKGAEITRLGFGTPPATQQQPGIGAGLTPSFPMPVGR